MQHLNQLFSPSIINYLQNLKGDCFINILSPVIVPIKVLNFFPDQAFNLHTGPLPSYAGIHVHQWGIRNGETSFATTIHQMDAGIDTGNIVAESFIKISPNDTGLSLFNKVISSGIELFIKVINDIINEKKISSYKQDLSNRVYFSHSDALDGKIDWNNSSLNIINFIRAGNYKPFISPSYSATLDSDIFIFKAEKFSTSKKTPGKLISLNELGPEISCGDGRTIRITHAEKKSKKMNFDLWERFFISTTNYG